MPIEIFDLGLINFKKAWDFQKKVFEEVRDNHINSGLILCSHNPVITLGRAGNSGNILAYEEELKAKGITIFNIERGGDVTYHGPGQLVAYPIINLACFKKDIHLFLRKLEDIIMRSLSSFGVKADRLAGLTGVWVGKEKIASIGVSIRRWISFHGLSINVRDEDLPNFRLIRPCGMNIEMTSLETITEKKINMEDLKDKVARQFQEAYQYG